MTVEKRTYCRFCLGYCGVMVELDGETVVGVRGDREHPISQGYTCPKGRALGAFHEHPDRLDVPLIRRDGVLRRAGWDEALGDLGRLLGGMIETHGAAAVATYEGTYSVFDGSAAAMTARFMGAIGSPSRHSTLTVDVPSGPYIAELVAGSPWLTPIPDPDARFVLLLGTNPMHSHGHILSLTRPKAWLRHWAANGQLWVVDPRRSETAAVATGHLAVRPGSDYALLAYCVREILIDGADREYVAERVAGVERLAAAVEPFDLASAARITGLDPGELEALVEAMRRAGRVAVHPAGTGTSFARGANVVMWLSWALAAITGALDRAEGMPIRPGMLRGMQRTGWEVSDGVPEPGPPSRPDLPRRWGQYPTVALLDEIEAGDVRALVVVGGNLLTALPDTPRTIAALRSLEALVVIDVVETETTRLATHLLPATGQLERADLDPVDFFGMRPVLQLTDAVVAPRARRRSVWWILAQLGRRLGVEVMPGGLDVEAATDLDVLRALHGGAEPEQWARLEAASPAAVLGEPPEAGWTRQFLPEGRWRIAPQPLVDQLATLEPPPADGLLMITRRMLRKVNSHMADGHGVRDPARPEAELHPRDAEAAGIVDGDLVRVGTEHGSIELAARVTDRIAPGAVSVPNGFAAAWVGNLVSGTDLDPLTAMPIQSALPLSVERVGAAAGE
ncbi:MAG: molybdopterin-dependent oxidoreductase [Actinobacteria bacterium]|nr:molybdopterin-dependent oxidoreductase [Actinomycetota bacterium]